MDIWTAFSRAKRGFRDDLHLHIVAIASLVVAFLCLGTALLSVENLTRVAERMSQSQHLTLYLRDAAKEGEVSQLRLVLESLPEVQKVEYISAAAARKLFAEQTHMGTSMSDLPTDAFPASLEIELASNAAADRVDKLTERLKRFSAVEEVENYRSFLGQFHGLLDAGRSGALVLALLVVVCVIAVIGNTIRLAVAGRRREIEVLKLCGATDSFVRSPLVIEGVIQGVSSSAIALLLLLVGYLLAHNHVEAMLSSLTGVSTVFLSPWTVAATITLAGIVGGVGSAWSLRRYLQV
ncbi:MAG TPA: permease-like cell division protein FtsX [Polyangiales bacterium]|nr:permease-like cell division protein FtsX [Polyangiales bacterium]